jgi:hypothetical protein
MRVTGPAAPSSERAHALFNGCCAGIMPSSGKSSSSDSGDGQPAPAPDDRLDTTRFASGHDVACGAKLARRHWHACAIFESIHFCAPRGHGNPALRREPAVWTPSRWRLSLRLRGGTRPAACCWPMLGGEHAEHAAALLAERAPAPVLASLAKWTRTSCTRPWSAHCSFCLALRQSGR